MLKIDETITVATYFTCALVLTRGRFFTFSICIFCVFCTLFMANLCVFSDKIVFCMDKKVKISRFLSLIYKKFNHFGSNFSDFGKTVL